MASKETSASYTYSKEGDWKLLNFKNRLLQLTGNYYTSKIGTEKTYWILLNFQNRLLKITPSRLHLIPQTQWVILAQAPKTKS